MFRSPGPYGGLQPPQHLLEGQHDWARLHPPRHLLEGQHDWAQASQEVPGMR